MNEPKKPTRRVYPINRFEREAYSIWKGVGDEVPKAERLRTLAKRITDYTAVLEKIGRSRKLNDWQSRFVKRRKSYLAKLAKDVADMADGFVEKSITVAAPTT